MGKPEAPDTIRIVLAADCPPCPDCEEPWCEEHGEHYGDCACVGPSNADELGYDVVEKDGKLWGIKRSEPRDGHKEDRR